MGDRMVSVMCLDPGLRATGYAYWRPLRDARPDDSGVWRIPASAAWMAACTQMWYSLTRYLRQRHADLVVIEFPRLWTGSAVSHASCESGDLFKLAYLVGGYARTGSTDDSDVTLVYPHEWKGQLSKEAVQDRLVRRLGVRYANHEADAVGIGLYVWDCCLGLRRRRAGRR
jgi:hypothetical protein